MATSGLEGMVIVPRHPVWVGETEPGLRAALTYLILPRTESEEQRGQREGMNASIDRKVGKQSDHHHRRQGISRQRAAALLKSVRTRLCGSWTGHQKAEKNGEHRGKRRIAEDGIHSSQSISPTSPVTFIIPRRPGTPCFEWLKTYITIRKEP